MSNPDRDLQLERDLGLAHDPAVGRDRPARPDLYRPEPEDPESLLAEMWGNNVVARLGKNGKGNPTLVLEIDLTRRLRVSATGKSVIVASGSYHGSDYGFRGELSRLTVSTVAYVGRPKDRRKAKEKEKKRRVLDWALGEDNPLSGGTGDRDLPPWLRGLGERKGGGE